MFLVLPEFSGVSPCWEWVRRRPALGGDRTKLPDTLVEAATQSRLPVGANSRGVNAGAARAGPGWSPISIPDPPRDLGSPHSP